ncbi:MAG: TetR/AcrR family transcriptional regulator [Actinomycetota bacterium]
MTDRPATIAEEAAPRAPLTRERIVIAGLYVMNTEGLEAVTMRRLGRRLSVEAMSLYHHVQDKDDLLTAMSEQILREMDVPQDPGGDPLEQLRVLSQSFRRVLLAYPEGVKLFTASRAPFRSPEALRPIDRTLAVLQRTGLSDQDVVNAYCLFVGYTLGFVTNEVSGFLSSEAQTRKAATTEDVLAAMSEAFPSLARFLPSMADRDPEANFAFGLEVILGGIAERVARSDG